MDDYTANPIPAPEPTEIPNRRRGVLAGALLGAVALTASVVGISAVAGAQDDPEVDADPTEAVEASEMDDDAEIIELDGDDLDGEIMLDVDDEAWAAFDQCISDALGSIDEPSEDTELTDEQWEALEAQFEAAETACEDTLPEDVKAEIAAYAPYEECIDGQLDGVEEPNFDEDISDEQLEALDAAWMAADEACFDLLPEDAKADAEAFKAYDQCLSDAGFGDDSIFGEDAEFGTVVYVEDGETGQSIQFGEDAGTVTITGDANGVAVATEGDVTVLDDAAFEEAFSACDDPLPEGLMDLDETDVDEFDLDEGELDEDDGTEDEGDEDGDDEDA